MKKINLAKNAGFCFGVKRAIKLANDTASKHRNVFMLGDIVHNPKVVSDIKNAGIKKIRSLSKNKNGILIIRAHGAPLTVYQKAARLGYKIVDATCPMVKEIHSTAKKYESLGYKIIIIGDKKHAEVIGIKGNLKYAPLILSLEEKIPAKKLVEIKKSAIVVQSTQNLEKTQKFVREIKKLIPEVKFFNTICLPTRQKQKEIKELPASNDAMVIIGSQNSANTKRLYEISRSINPNTYRVNSKREIKKCWFQKTQSIGITAGASTPDYLIREISSFIEKL